MGENVLIIDGRMKTNENVRKWTKMGKKRTKTYESVKTRLKTDENV